MKSLTAVIVAEDEGGRTSQNVCALRKFETLQSDAGQLVLVDMHGTASLTDAAAKLLGLLDGQTTSVDEPHTSHVLELFGDLGNLLNFFLCRHVHLPSYKSTPAGSQWRST